MRAPGDCYFDSGSVIIGNVTCGTVEMYQGSGSCLVSNINAINPALYSKMPFDPNKDLIPIAPLVSLSNVLVLHPSVKANSVAEVIAMAKAQPGKTNYASSGSGTSIHMSGEMFQYLTKTTMTHIPYKGSGPAITDLLGGQVMMMFDNIPSALPHIKSGKLRALAVTSAQPSALYPELPTLAATVSEVALAAQKAAAEQAESERRVEAAKALEAAKVAEKQRIAALLAEQQAEAERQAQQTQQAKARQGHGWRKASRPYRGQQEKPVTTATAAFRRSLPGAGAPARCGRRSRWAAPRPGPVPSRDPLLNRISSASSPNTTEFPGPHRTASPISTGCRSRACKAAKSVGSAKPRAKRFRRSSNV